MNNIENCLKALEYDDTLVAAYLRLAGFVGVNETVTLRSGDKLGKVGLYVKAIEHGSGAEAHFKLASWLDEGQSVKLASGESCDERALYLKAIDMDPNYALAYYNLALCLAPKEEVKLLNGESVDKRWLYMKCIENNPKEGDAYYNLANAVDLNEKYMLKDGELYDKKRLLVKAIEFLEKASPEPFFNLANLLGLEGPQATIELASGKQVGERDLYLMCVEADQEFVHGLYSLGFLMGPSETVKLGDDAVSKKQLFLKALALDGAHGGALRNLAATLEAGEKVTVGGQEIDAKALLLKALSNPGDVAAHVALGNLLADGEEVQLPSGETADKERLYERARGMYGPDAVAHFSATATK